MHGNWHGLGRRWLATLVCLACLGWAAGAAAHPVTVNGQADDWAPVAPPVDNTGHIFRSASQAGEYQWLDPTADERTDFASPDMRVDLREVRITSDANGLYFLVRMRDIDLVTGDGAPQIQIAIAPPSLGVGERWLGMNCDTRVAAAAAWQRLVVTRFGSAKTPVVYDTTWTDVSGGLATAAISATDEVIEIGVPWSVLGGVPTAPIKFTVVSLRANGTDDDAWDLAGVPDVLDAVTNYGDPGPPPAATTTWNELSAPGDDVIDYHFEVWFHLDPDTEPSAPVVVNEVMYDTPCAEPGSEWIEIYNRTGVDNFPIAGFVLTDEEAANGGEGARAFPAGATIPAAGVRLVANNAVTYGTCFPLQATPDFHFQIAGPPTPMPTFPGWASGAVNLSNTGDEVLLLDAYATVIDVLVWDGGAYPGVVIAPDVVNDHSLERPQPRQDSNDCAVDFVDHPLADITPGKVLPLDALGGACTQWIECSSDHCTDGVCCVSDCSGTCAGTCGNTGTCNEQLCPLPITVCQLATCDPVSGCSAAQGTSCVDGDACTQTDACDGAGVCAGSNPVTCTALDECHGVGTCDALNGTCSNPPLDGTPCTGGTCVAGVCVAGGGGSGGTAQGGSGGVAQGGSGGVGGVAQGGSGGVPQGGSGGVGGVAQGGSGGVGGVAQGGSGGTAQGGNGTGNTGTGGSLPPVAEPTSSGRCGCRLVARDDGGAGPFGLGVLVALGLVRRRRRRRPS
ncbi:MAG: lamin tail domain-containing protein [Polyangiaceae bacterium]|nr:lamin tail domain-containing protein [Polyangiaceae bacterium]